MKSKGFSLIEVQDMINVVAIIALLAAIAYPMWRDGNMSDFEKQQLHAELERKYGVRCISGYKFAQSDYSNPPVQILGPDRAGVPCN